MQLILEKLGLLDILQEELSWLNNSYGKPGGPPAPSQVPGPSRDPADLGESSRHMTQQGLTSPHGQEKLASILTNIRRTKDHSSCEVVRHQRTPRSTKKPSPQPRRSESPPQVANKGAKRKKFSKPVARIESDSSDSGEAIVNNSQDIVEESPKKSLKVIEKFAFQKKTTKKISLKTQESQHRITEIPETSSESDNDSNCIVNSIPAASTKEHERDKENESSTPKPVQSKVSLTTIEKLKKFSCHNKSPETSSPNSSPQTCKSTQPEGGEGSGDREGKARNSVLDELVMCGRQLSQLSRTSSQSSQSPLMSGRHPFLAADDDDDLDLSLS